MRRLYRSRTKRILGGISGGLADCLAIDVVLIRIIWVILALGAGSGLMAYIICWYIIPNEPGGHSMEPKRALDPATGEWEHRVIGLFLIVIGLFILLHRFSGTLLVFLNRIFPQMYWHLYWHMAHSLFWPLLIIMAGLTLISGGLGGGGIKVSLAIY